MKNASLLKLTCFLVVLGFLTACKPQSSTTTQPSTDTPVQTTTVTTDTSKEMTQTAQTSSGYVEYSPDAFTAANGKKKVLFFHAQWCPDCRAANSDIESRLSEIPEDLVIFKTDYDNETALKKQYAITYQHTFVQVDDAGNELKKWNGGNLTKILETIN